MKTRIKIRKSAVAAPVDFGRALDLHEVNGVKLKYTEYDFLILDGGAVFFDAYSSTHTYKPLPVECGAIAFPFTCECMTDVGERIAYAGLRFSEQQPVRWELLGKDEVLGLLPVDNDAAAVPITSGVCCFADENAYRLYTSHLKDEIHPLAGMIVLNGQTHATVELYGKKFAVFSTGWGDGRYKRYCGYDEAGAACRVLCDFGMIEYERDDTLVEIEAETGDSGQYVYDPAKSDSENNIAQWTHALRGATTADDRLHAFIRRGYAYHLAGDPALALGDYLSAISCSKSARLCGDAAQYRVWSAYEGAASLYCERSDYDSAIALMTDYISAQGDAYGDAYVKLIDLYQVTKRTDLALKTAESLIKLRPDDPVPLVKYAECAVSAMDYREAAAAFDKLATQFRLYENLFDGASCLIEIGDYEGARRMLERHPAKQAHEQYWYCLAYIDFKNHGMKSAREHALRSYGLDGEYMPALYLLMDIEALLQNHLAVAQYAEQYKRLRPDAEYGYSVCAEAFLTLGNFSESARNYLYLYEHIKPTDRYCALAALCLSASGEAKRADRLLKTLKRKRSVYYYGAVYGVYFIKYTERDSAIDKVMYMLAHDEEFLFLLAVYLLQTNNVRSATRMLETLCKDDKTRAEATALQIRAAEKIGDKKLFMSFLDHYVNRFIDPDFPPVQKAALAERLMSSPSKRRDWINEILD